MTALTGRDYVEVTQLLADAFTLLPTTRTGRPLASAQATDLTIITHRVAYEREITAALPALVIDVNPSRPIRYVYNGTVATRGLPVVIAVYTPNYAYLDGQTEAEVQAAVVAADEDVKTLLGDIESLLTGEEVRRRVCKHFELLQTFLPMEDIVFGESHVRCRLAEIWGIAWNPVH